MARKGITVNGIAPAVIEDTAMLPEGSAEIASSKSLDAMVVLSMLVFWMLIAV